MGQSDYDRGTHQEHMAKYIAANQPHTSWRNAAFLCSVLALVGAGAYSLWWVNAPLALDATGVKTTAKPYESPYSLIDPEPAATEQPITPRGTSQATGQSQGTSLTVNGKDIPLPANGSYHQTINGGNNQGTLDVSVQHQSTGSSNISNTSISYQSSSSSGAE